jgi:hypothetical protein
VTRSGTNSVTASAYYRTRDESFVGTEASGQTVNPGSFTTHTTGVWAGGPIVKNRLFAFGAYEKQEDTRPLTTFQSNPGGAPVGGNTRATSDLSGLSNFLSTNLHYETGPFDSISKVTPRKPWMIKGDYTLNSANKVTFRYNQLDSSSDVPQSGSSSLGTSRQTNTTQFLTFSNSNYQILENLRSGIGEWNSVFGSNWTNNLLTGVTHQDESRGDKGQVPAFPFVVIGDGTGGAYTSFGNEPFTPFNLSHHVPAAGQRDEVREEPLDHVRRQRGEVPLGQLVLFRHPERLLVQHACGLLRRRERVPREPESHGGGRAESLPGEIPAAARADDAADAAARRDLRGRLRAGRVAAENEPHGVGRHPRRRAEVRQHRVRQPGRRHADLPRSGRIAGPSTPARSLIRWRTGRRASASTTMRPAIKERSCAAALASSAASRRRWISNQIGNTGVLYGFLIRARSCHVSVQREPDRYKPAPTGGTAASYELDDGQSLPLPQTWRSNIGVDRKLRGASSARSTIYNRDLNAPVYINVNLLAASTASRASTIVPGGR